ncbi:hypothetical protein TCAL_12115 [Tigriopus californicus]|uniref:Probable hydroxyacid-oxoacid transhydrogenase, mitochondrial n=1 Tax=Tigriopus californicus TaxID=6832 RepID=A0A553P1W2_TIGCA|nr:hydroxyacid-oxoacid transhydrogenase, mitochondrial-like [Tigriopus californicus]TRY71669.1 hypothetical protein TCAL_12115 [Tigriopus californicus]|eukprot:TCALIF_12115-PA protein Name:"Similar to AGAP006646 Probable hydroxyacid-oxoacid transhydrogenase, mitochondrial (Anopheles gambiae)" AED:0.07 eAED:0.07 QI:251/1/1/1/0.62/0.55/9/307/469
MSSRSQIVNLIHSVGSSCRCPAHSQTFSPIITGPHRFSTQPNTNEYAFEMACSNIRYGPGVTQEVGQDLNNIKATNVGVYTDKTVAKLPAMKATLESLSRHKVNFKVFEDVRVEPTNESFIQAADFAKSNGFDAFLAVGGGSVMDTCKAANLYASDPSAEFLDYVSAPIGKGLPVRVPLMPLIAIPTTSGTGSETTGVAVFDYLPLNAKVGIANRALRPLLGLIDPLHTLTMPERVAAFSGFDVLCHALESFTAINYHERQPRPVDPILRPAYQGSNPISDVWARNALGILNKYFARSVYNPDDVEARSEMHLAATTAGVGFGNAGVHLCHGLSYSIAGMVKEYKPVDYSENFPIIPHGLSVVITAPAVFEFTGKMCPEKHLEGAELLGYDKIRSAKRADAGKILSDTLKTVMDRLKIPNGLSALGYGTEDIPGLVKGAIPQDRVNKLAPRPQSEADLAGIYENSLTVY